MPVVANPLPIKTPDTLGTDRTAVLRLWKCVDDLVNIARAILGGRLIEWHVDEPLTTALIPIPHGLRRKPFGMLLFRSTLSTFPITNYEAWTETTICPSDASASTVSFILF